MNHLQVSIAANEEQQEILISQLSDLGAEGFEQTESHLLAYFNELNFDSYAVNELLKGHSFLLNTIEEKNWNEVWESNFEPVTVEDFCAVRAEFHSPIPQVKHEIIITPKMSFGTGHHATTYMMMSDMRDLSFQGKKVFDFGTGTGILAILAEKLGASHIEAIDVEEWSIKNSIENAQRNNCHRINFHQTSQLPEDKFDLILANINRNVILEYLPVLKEKLNQEGQILFSGLLTTDEKVIDEACKREGLHFIRKKERNNWIALLYLKGL